MGFRLKKSVQDRFSGLDRSQDNGITVSQLRQQPASSLFEKAHKKMRISTGLVRIFVKP
ncbi:hypothetical protein LFAB_00035 [Lactiplantibacillus fabifermentans T30PCM01]|uniref:Uncharacterized protein n=1 Tax=Lactiplantibacillus fabifermentans T30PCM01 TaxID=1400520 RepID=W6TDV8_9LACO|nr:hypothetical protein LFAB_00035 [Lactiplantibacillus fabifermentans T30PCM01]